MPEELKDAIEKNAQGPKSARGDVGAVEQHSLAEQSEADRYLSSREAQAKPTRRSGSRSCRRLERIRTAESSVFGRLKRVTGVGAAAEQTPGDGRRLSDAVLALWCLLGIRAGGVRAR
jgi:hypothetical protein